MVWPVAAWSFFPPPLVLSPLVLAFPSVVNKLLLGARLQKAELHRAVLDNANLRLAHLRDVSLSSVASILGVHLYQTRFWGVLDLRYEQFLDDSGQSTIWEHTEGRFSEAKDVYKTLKGYFEDAGDYEGANWAYINEQRHEKWKRCPPKLGRIIYPRWRGKYNNSSHVGEFCDPKVLEWLRLEFAEKIANYGDSLLRPLIWLGVLILAFAALYWITGSVTSMPGCGYAELSAIWRSGCAPTRNLLDHLWFSLGAITTIDVGTLRAFKSHTGVLMTLEMLTGIGLTGLIGFVLGNKLRFS